MTATMGAGRLSGATVLVTGAGGFIGSWVTQELVAAGARVRAIASPPGVPFVAPPPGVEVHQLDIPEAENLGDFLAGADLLVHMAGPPSVAGSFAAPVEFTRAHVLGTVRLLEACRGMGLSRAVWVSSAEVYGSPPLNPVGEAQPVAPLSPYGAAKVGAEALIRVLTPEIGIESVILRPFSVYGPGMRRTSVLATVLRQAMDCCEVVVADPRPVRDFCFVADAAQAVLASCDARLSERVSTFNVGSGQGISVAELAEKAMAATGRAVPMRTARQPDRPPTAAVTELVADVSSAARQLGWVPLTSIESGLLHTLSWLNTAQAASPCPEV